MRLEAAAGRPELGRGDVAEVLRLTWPAVAHMALVALTFIGDRAIVGRDPQGLAALHLPSTIAWCLASGLSSVGVGAVALVGRSHGARRALDRAAAIDVSLSMARKAGLWAMPVAIALGLVLLPLLEGSLRLPAMTYLVIAAAALPACAVEAAAAGSLQAMGDTRTPLFAATAGAVVHLGITLAGAHLGLGLEGAALGTVVGFAVAAAGCLVALRQAAGCDAPDELVTARKELRRLLGPIAGERLGFHLGYLAFAALIAELGPTAMAANQALLALEALAYPVAEGAAIVAGAVVAQRLGEGDRPRAQQGFSVCATLAVGALALFSLAALVAPGILLVEGPVGELAERTLPWLALSQPAMAFAMVGAMALRGAGATRSVMGITLAGTALRLTLALLLGPELGLEGAYIASAGDWLLQSLAVLWLVSRRFRA